nr:family 16 glycoside hydrolase [uncultured Allomuricauda sp.]
MTIALLISGKFLFAQSIPLTPQNWQVVDNENNQELDLQVSEYKGKSAIHLGRHEIVKLKTNTYENFVLEMDIAGKAMPGIGFRAKDLWDYEFLYFRVFSGGKDDAIQYIPVFHGSHPWQLYNEPTYETSAEFKSQEWFHIKVEVFDKNMRVFIGDKETPNMQVELLQKECDSGDIFLKTSFAEAYFSNAKIQPLEKPFTIEQPRIEFKYITEWEISEQLQGNIRSQRQFFEWIENAEKNHKWQSIEADKTGIINMAQYYEHPKESAFAKTTIHSDVPKTVTLAYDYTQVLLISLNNKIIFYGRELDMDNFMRVTDREQTIELSLNKGENKLVFWIRSDDEWQNEVGNPPYLGRKQAMNWGFMARLLQE